MEYEEDMRPEKNVMPNYFMEWSTFDDDNDNKSSMTIIKYAPLYEIEVKRNNIEIDYGSDNEY